MARIGDLPSVPDEFVDDVVATSWSLSNTNRDPKLVVVAEAGQLATQCPSCKSRLIIDVIGHSDRAGFAPRRTNLDAPVSGAMRHATQIEEHAQLAVAAELLVLSPRRLAVVVDCDHRPLGVLTPTRVLAALEKESKQFMETTSAVAASGPTGPLLPMSTPINTAACILGDDDRDFTLIVDDAGVLMGVLLATDVLAALRA